MSVVLIIAYNMGIIDTHIYLFILDVKHLIFAIVLFLKSAIIQLSEGTRKEGITK